MAIPLTRIHILHRRRAERREGGRGEQSGYPPFRVCLCATVEAGIAASAPQLPERGPGYARNNKARAEGRAGGEEDRDRGPSPYIISSPERVAIISRQWPADRSASQKGPGPHNSRDASSTTLRAIVGLSAPSRLLFSPRTGEFLLTATGPATSITRRVSCRARGETTRTTQTGYSGKECVYQASRDARVAPHVFAGLENKRISTFNYYNTYNKSSAARKCLAELKRNEHLILIILQCFIF